MSGSGPTPQPDNAPSRPSSSSGSEIGDNPVLVSEMSEMDFVLVHPKLPTTAQSTSEFPVIFPSTEHACQESPVFQPLVPCQGGNDHTTFPPTTAQTPSTSSKPRPDSDKSTQLLSAIPLLASKSSLSGRWPKTSGVLKSLIPPSMARKSSFAGTIPPVPPMPRNQVPMHCDGTELDPYQYHRRIRDSANRTWVHLLGRLSNAFARCAMHRSDLQIRTRVSHFSERTRAVLLPILGALFYTLSSYAFIYYSSRVGFGLFTTVIFAVIVIVTIAVLRQSDRAARVWAPHMDLDPISNLPMLLNDEDLDDIHKSKGDDCVESDGDQVGSVFIVDHDVEKRNQIGETKLDSSQPHSSPPTDPLPFPASSAHDASTNDEIVLEDLDLVIPSPSPPPSRLPLSSTNQPYSRFRTTQKDAHEPIDIETRALQPARPRGQIPTKHNSRRHTALSSPSPTYKFVPTVPAPTNPIRLVDNDKLQMVLDIINVGILYSTPFFAGIFIALPIISYSCFGFNSLTAVICVAQLYYYYQFLGDAHLSGEQASRWLRHHLNPLWQSVFRYFSVRVIAYEETDMATARAESKNALFLMRNMALPPDLIRYLVVTSSIPTSSTSPSNSPSTSSSSPLSESNSNSNSISNSNSNSNSIHGSVSVGVNVSVMSGAGFEPNSSTSATMESQTEPGQNSSPIPSSSANVLDGSSVGIVEDRVPTSSIHEGRSCDLSTPSFSSLSTPPMVPGPGSPLPPQTYNAPATLTHGTLFPATPLTFSEPGVSSNIPTCVPCSLTEDQVPESIRNLLNPTGTVGAIAEEEGGEIERGGEKEQQNDQHFDKIDQNGQNAQKQTQISESSLDAPTTTATNNDQDTISTTKTEDQTNQSKEEQDEKAEKTENVENAENAAQHPEKAPKKGKHGKEEKWGKSRKPLQRTLNLGDFYSHEDLQLSIPYLYYQIGPQRYKHLKAMVEHDPEFKASREELTFSHKDLIIENPHITLNQLPPISLINHIQQTSYAWLPTMATSFLLTQMPHGIYPLSAFFSHKTPTFQKLFGNRLKTEYQRDFEKLQFRASSFPDFYGNPHPMFSRYECVPFDNTTQLQLDSAKFQQDCYLRELERFYGLGQFVEEAEQKSQNDQNDEQNGQNDQNSKPKPNDHHVEKDSLLEKFTMGGTGTGAGVRTGIGENSEDESESTQRNSLHNAPKSQNSKTFPNSHHSVVSPLTFEDMGEDHDESVVLGEERYLHKLHHNDSNHHHIHSHSHSPPASTSSSSSFSSSSPSSTLFNSRNLKYSSNSPTTNSKSNTRNTQNAQNAQNTQPTASPHSPDSSPDLSSDENASVLHTSISEALLNEPHLALLSYDPVTHHLSLPEILPHDDRFYPVQIRPEHIHHYERSFLPQILKQQQTLYPSHGTRLSSPTDIDVLGASVLSFTPGLREVFLMNGGADVSRNSLLLRLTTNRSCLLIPGGQREMVYSSHLDYNYHFHTGHLGFVKIALRTGAPLVPIISFGENQILSTVRWPDLQMWLYSKTRVFLPLYPHGPAMSPVPHSSPITLAVGEPIFVPCFDTDDIPDDVVRYYHNLYLAHIARLFFDSRGAVPFAQNATLTFVS